MKISEIISKLEKSKTFKDFKKTPEGKDSYFCAAFIILNIKQGGSENSLDFRNEKDIFTFRIPSDEKAKEEIIMQKEEIIPSRKQLEKLDEKLLGTIKINPEDIQKIIEKELKEKKVSGEIEEIIAVLQVSDDKKSLIWNLTCIVSGFVILSIQINAETGKILKFDKKNLLDFVTIKKPGEKQEKK